MWIIVRKHRVELLLSMEQRAKVFAGGKWQEEAFRGVVDAGRRTKTQVQRAVHHQMATKQYGFVVANTRGTPRRAELAYEIYALVGGQRIEIYKGLQALAVGGDAAARYNAARSAADRGQVRSGVWNVPRVFKRSFAANGGYFAILPGTRTTAPKALWTYGLKPTQPRDNHGRFASPGRTYGPIRRLFGPALRKELPKDESLATFYRVGPVQLETQVMKRMAKLMTL